MRKIKMIIVSLLLMTTSSILAQESEKSNDELKEEFKELIVKLEGTYQIQVTESRVVPNISFDLLKEIDSKRSENETIFIQKEHYSIEIPSRKEIDSEEFKPLERVVYS